MAESIVSSENINDITALEKWLSGYEMNTFDPDNAIINRLSPTSEEDYFIRNVSEISAIMRPSGKVKLVISFEYLKNNPKELKEVKAEKSKGKSVFKIGTFELIFENAESLDEEISPSDGLLKLQLKTVVKNDRLILVVQNKKSLEEHKKDKNMRLYDWCYSAFSVNVTVSSSDEFLQLPSRIGKVSYLAESKSYCKTYNTSYVPKEINGKVCQIRITSMPVFEEQRYKTWDMDKEDENLLEFNSYSFKTPSEEIIKNLNRFIQKVQKHSEKTLSEYKSYVGTDEKYINEFEMDSESVNSENELAKKSIERLSLNEDAMWAFRFLNDVMAEKSQIDFYSWRPFQLVFILNLIADYFLKQKKKSAVLLNFPTGMGKTEAFMGFSLWLSAYLRKTENNYGTTTLIKYPRVMLSKQQARRAIELYTTANKCILKQKGIRLHPFSVGVLYSKEDTPNNILSNLTGEGFSHEFIKLESSLKSKKQIGFQLDKCPACEEAIEINPIRNKARIIFRCKNKNCIYNQKKFESFFETEDGEIPLYISDEEVFRYAPTVVLTTIYKFASFCNSGRWKNLLGGKVKDLKTDKRFGLYFYTKDREDAEKYEKKYGYEWFSGTDLKNMTLRPPSLTVVDETHLLSGAQAGLVGPIETAFLDIFRTDEEYPLVICSSATVNKGIINQNERVYQHQIAQLFGTRLKDIKLFPSSLDVYRSEEQSLQRTIVAFYPSIFTQMFAQEKVGSYIFTRISREKSDYYKTPIFYFNSKSEMSQVKHYAFESRVTDVIGNNELKRHFIEFSADLEPADVDAQLEQIQKGGSWQVVLATNTIANGIDSKFFNTIVFNGLPNSVSEYVQARSRIARSKDCRGLSIMILNRNSPRERAFLEDFIDWHMNYEYFYEENPVNKYSDGIVNETIPRLFHLYSFWSMDDPDKRVYLTKCMYKKLEEAKDDVNQHCENLLASWLVSPLDQSRVSSQVKTKISSWIRRYATKMGERQAPTIYNFENHGTEFNPFLPSVSILQFSDLVEVSLSRQSISDILKIMKLGE